MIRILAIIIALQSACFGLEIQDFINWRSRLPCLSGIGGNLEPFMICDKSFSASAKYGNLYGIEGYNWNSAILSYGFGKFGFAGEIAIHGLSDSERNTDLYSNNLYSIYFAVNPIESIAIRAGYNYEMEKFENIADYAAKSLNFCMAIKMRSFFAAVSFKDIYYKTEYDGPRFNKLGIQLDANYKIYDWTGVSVGINRSSFDEFRFQFSQDVMISDYFGLALGYASNPNSLYWAAKINYKGLEFELMNSNTTYLENTMILTLSFRTAIK